MGQGICHNTCMSVAKLTVNPTPNTGRLLFYIGQVGFMSLWCLVAQRKGMVIGLRNENRLQRRSSGNDAGRRDHLSVGAGKRPHTGRTSVLSDNRGNRKERALMKKASGVYGHIGEEVSSEKFAGWPAILRGPVRNDSAM